jgi:hypothetical protein
MDSTYRSIKASLPQLTTFELVDLMQEIDDELKDREAGYEELRFGEQGIVDPDVLAEYDGMAYDD